MATSDSNARVGTDTIKMPTFTIQYDPISCVVFNESGNLIAVVVWDGRDASVIYTHPLMEHWSKTLSVTIKMMLIANGIWLCGDSYSS